MIREQLKNMTFVMFLSFCFGTGLDLTPQMRCFGASDRRTHYPNWVLLQGGCGRVMHYEYLLVFVCTPAIPRGRVVPFLALLTTGAV